MRKKDYEKDYEMVLFCLRANPALGQKVAEHIGIKLGQADIRNYSDGEIWLKEINTNMRDYPVFIIQPICANVDAGLNVNDSLVELLTFVDACRRSSAGPIIAVIPYYGYNRQDHKDGPRQAITARMIADLLEKVGVSRVIAIDLHSSQTQGFFSIPVDNLYASYVFLPDILQRYDKNRTVIVAADVGDVKRAKAYQTRIGCRMALAEKERPRPNECYVSNIIGHEYLPGKIAVIVDDIGDTLNTFLAVEDKVLAYGASDVVFYVTHPVVSGPALANLQRSRASRIVFSDTIALPEAIAKLPNVEVVSIASLLGEAIIKNVTHGSVASLFN